MGKGERHIYIFLSAVRCQFKFQNNLWTDIVFVKNITRPKFLETTTFCVKNIIIYAICVNVTANNKHLRRNYTNITQGVKKRQIDYSHVFILYFNYELIMNYNLTFG